MNSNTKVKRLLFIIADIHLGGGGERVAVNMANHYYSLGWHIEFVSFMCPQGKHPFNLNNDILISYLKVSGNKILQKLRETKRLKAFLADREDDYVIAIGSHPSTILGFSRCKGVITIGTEHSHFYHAPRIWNYLRKWSYKNLSAVVVLTNEDLPILRQYNDNVYVIPNALSFFPRIFASMNRKNLLAIGRFDKNKQFDKLIDIYYKLDKKVASWTLSIVGDGELKHHLLRKVDKYGLNGKVIIKPFTSEIGKEYINASVLVSTSKKEGLPMVMIEAQSYGLPIVSYDCKTGPKEIIIDGQNGFLVPLDDEDAMLEALERITQDSELRIRMSENAIHDSHRFSPDSVYKKWDFLFDKLNNNAL